MKKIKLKPKKSPKKSDKSLPSSSSHKSPPKSSKPLTSSNGHHHTSASLDPCTVGQPPLLQSEKQPKVRKVARGWSEDGLVSSTKSLQVNCLVTCLYTRVLYTGAYGPPKCSWYLQCTLILFISVWFSRETLKMLGGPGDEATPQVLSA